MKIRRDIMRVGASVILSAALVLGPIRSFAATATTTYAHVIGPDLFITELQTASTASGGEEFVEFYNNTDTDIDFADTAHAGKDAWKLQYFSSSKLSGLLATSDWASPTRTISLTGTISAHDYYLLAAGTYQPGSLVPDQTYTSTLADDGGAVQLVDSTTTGTTTTLTIHNQLAWSSGASLPASSVLVVAPGAGKSLQRLPNADDEYVNDDGTLTTFTTDSLISPDNAWVPPAPVTSPDPGSSSDTTGDDPTSNPVIADNIGLATPIITELLPNPVAPQTDEADEYIELYNPNDTAFDLNGYTLQTGETTLHNFTFTSDVLVEPHSFRAFFSAETGLSLSNSGGQARLLDKDQNLLNQSDSYSTAADGQAWALGNDGVWQWTITPTPSAGNVINAPVKTSAVKTAVKVTKKSTAKVKGVTTTIKKAAKPKKVTKPASPSANASTATPVAAPIHTGVLAAVAVLAVGYMMYEYRKDVANYLYQLRTNRAARRAARG